MLASQDDSAISNDALLTGTGSGGLFTSGYLRDKPLIEYLSESERVAVLLSNSKKGLRREGEGSSDVYRPGDGYQAIAAVTDTRVRFVIGDGGDDGDETVSIPYTDVEAVRTGRNVLTKYLEVRTTSGDTWRFFVSSTVDLEPARAYVDLAAVVWTRVESQLRHARRELVAVTDHIADGDDDAATAAAASAREHVDVARRKAAELTDDRTDAVWERIGEAEQRLEQTVMKRYATRAEQLQAAGTSALDEDDYVEAHEALVSARNNYERALDVAREQNDARADEFRAAADEITHLLDQLSKAPLKRAEEVHSLARDADDPEIAAGRYEAALERYRDLLALDWGVDEPRFAGDTAELRETIETIVGELVQARRELANRAAEDGRAAFADGAYGQARDRYETAREHLAAALDVADELDPSLAADLRADLEDVTERVERADDRVSASGFEFVGDGDRVGDP